MNIKYINTSALFNGLDGTTINNSTRLCNRNGITYIEFTPFDKFDWVKLHFSTRLGGVSEGMYSSMNFSFDRGDSYDNVYKNYELFLDTMGLKPENCVCTKQTHTTNVLVADSSMAGMGLTKPRSFDNVDGLITNEPGLCLVTYFADCVPVYFIDPVNKSIGAAHSGWRGTVANITYELKESDMMLYHTRDDKYQLNLQTANYYNMIHEGILPDNIGISDICTSCNSDWLFSHRASHGKRGVLCGFMSICR